MLTAQQQWPQESRDGPNGISITPRIWALPWSGQGEGLMDPLTASTASLIWRQP